MKYIKFFAMLIAIVATISGCTTDELSLPQGEGQSIIAYAPGVDSEQTKVGFEENATTDNQIDLSWERGDEITIYKEDGSRLGDWEVEEVDKDGKASFVKLTGDNLAADEKYTAVYPSSSASTLTARNAEEIGNQEQDANDDMSHLDDNLRMKSATFKADETMAFSHELAIMSVEFSYSGVPKKLKIEDGTNLYELTLRDFKKGASQAYLMMAPNSNTPREVKVTVSGDVADAVDSKTTSVAFKAGNHYPWSTATRVPVTGVSLNLTELSFIEGTSETQTLIPMVAPVSASNRSVTWKSGNEDVATVAKGVVTLAAGAKAGETTTITATTVDGGFTAECKVIVVQSSYTVSFNSNEGTGGAMEKQEITAGVATALRENAFTRIGYDFVEWNTAADGSGTAYGDEAEITLTADLTLYAQWEVAKYIVEFYANGEDDDPIMTQEFTHGVPQKLTANTFTKEGYTFEGWSTEPDGAVVYTDEQEITLTEKNLTYNNVMCLLPVWAEEEAEVCTITFDANGGSGDAMTSQEFTAGVAAVVSENTYTKTDYVFAGWSEDASAEDPTYADGETITVDKSTTLYAVWYDLGNVVIIEGNAITGRKKYKFDKLTSITIPATYKGTAINSVAVSYSGDACQNTTLRKVVISEGITELGAKAFYGFNSIEDITLPSTLKRIKWDVFYCCYKLASITLPEGLEHIESEAFYRTTLKEVTLPSTLVNLDPNAFSQCKPLQNIYIAEGNITYSSYEGNLYTPDMKTLIKVANAKESVIFSSSVTSLGSESLKDCNRITEVVVPETIESIGQSVFQGAYMLKRVTLPASITEIPYGTFQACTALENVTMNGAITSIRDDAFRGTKFLKDIKIPATVEVIGNNVFEDGSLTSIVIPPLVSSMGMNVFNRCKYLTDIYVEGKEARPSRWSNNWLGYECSATVHWNESAPAE